MIELEEIQESQTKLQKWLVELELVRMDLVIFHRISGRSVNLFHFYVDDIVLIEISLDAAVNKII